MFFRKRVSVEDEEMLFRQLALLTGSGLTIPEAFKALAEERDPTPLGLLVASMHDEMQRGAQPGEVITRSLYQLRGLPRDILEKEGATVSGIFRDLASFTEKKRDLKRIMLGSLIYPAMIAIVLTNYASAENRKKSLDRGADYFFDKSHDVSKLTMPTRRSSNGSMIQTTALSALRCSN